MLNQVNPQDHPEHSYTWTAAEIEWIQERDVKWQEIVKQSRMPERLVALETALSRANSNGIYKGHSAAEWGNISAHQDQCIIGLQLLNTQLQAAWNAERNAEQALANLKELK